ncbi:DUF551 domain-containing protein [Klebsiella pneumoniae]|uniref:DUF551 domain-containing protein n=1 Tax=Klebsiella pneumoniae TaxID=573 RepID=UPI0027B912E7|nr:DUF551 domain-containing protein [Klebsiella pneumoniae]WLY03880.1 DUF551 domain-containing protein [Klebsiella pneumoniae]
MTKSTITRERLQEIAEDGFLKHGESKELARMALVAMDSEPDRNPVLAYADSYRDMAKQGVESVPIWSVITDLERNIAPLYRHAQPAPGYPEVLPCSVLLEPGLRFGKGIKTSTMLAALARRAVYESDMAALSPEERAEFHARIEDFKALIAHPVPVVPQDVLEALQKVARIRLDMNDFDGDRRGIADCLCDAEEALIEVVNRRADMLQGGSSPAQSDCCPAENHVSPEQNSVAPAQSGNSQAIPDGYVLVPKEATKEILDEFDSIIDYGAEDSVDAWHRLLAAATQEVKP